MVIDGILIPSNLTSTNELTGAQFSLYPNPVIDFISIEGLDQNVNLRVYNTNGQIVKTINNSNASRIDVSGLERGLYFINSPAFSQSISFVKK